MIPRKPPIHTFPDGREVCAATPVGRREYRRRTSAMRERQGNLCCLCGLYLSEEEATFEHQNGRGGGKRDDRIEVDGKWINGAAHFWCNNEKGSKRTPFVIQQTQDLPRRAIDTSLL